VHDRHDVRPEAFSIDKLGDVIFPFGRFVFCEQLLLPELVMDEAKAEDDVGENLTAAILGQNALQHCWRTGSDEIDFDLWKLLFKTGLEGHCIRGVHRQISDELSFFLCFLGQ